jgi:hypothetical protein
MAGNKRSTEESMVLERDHTPHPTMWEIAVLNTGLELRNQQLIAGSPAALLPFDLCRWVPRTEGRIRSVMPT